MIVVLPSTKVCETGMTQKGPLGVFLCVCDECHNAQKCRPYLMFTYFPRFIKVATIHHAAGVYRVCVCVCAGWRFTWKVPPLSSAP